MKNLPLPRFRLVASVAVAVLSLLESTSGLAESVALEHSALIDSEVAVFYPVGVGAETLPSLALTSEPVEIGPLPSEWELFPQFQSEEGRFIATFDLPPEYDLYGTGEVTGPLRRNGRTIELWNTDNYGYLKENGRRLYQTHPWVLGVRPDGSAFGVLFDSSWRSQLTTGRKQLRFASEGPPCRIIVIDRPTPQGVMEALGKLTGYMPLPPRWALGFQQCKWSYYPDSRVREIADEFRLRELPCDVIWLDIHYMDGYRVFTFDPEHFPDPSSTNQYLHDKGFKSVWMIDPGVKREEGYAVYDAGTEADVWVKNAAGDPFVGEVWPGDCVFPDFTRPETRSWWSDLYADFMSTGIDGVWNDMNEPAVFQGETMPADAWHRGGDDLPAGPHLRYHNTYGMLMVRATREGILAAQPDRRPFVLTRSNFLGGQRYAATWTGDNQSTWRYLKESIPMSLNLGLSGQPFNGPDVGGFGALADPLLFGHWMALGAFYPFSRAHNTYDGGNKEPWTFGPEIERVSQTALFRRYRLLPYLYTQMEITSRTGLPLMQPVYWADPSDRRLRREEQVFLFGPDLLVVPMWARDPALPKGQWREIRLLDGDRENDSYQPVLKIRDGAIVPLGKVVQNTTEPSLDPLSLIVSLDEQGQAEGWLYEDAGDGYAYREGGFARSHYVASTRGNKVSVRLDSREGDLEIAPRVSRVQLVTAVGTLTAMGDLREGVTFDLAETRQEITLRQKALESRAADPDPKRLLQEIERLQGFSADPEDPRPNVLCLGSSSFRFWDAQAALPEFEVFNCGFGGSEFSDLNALWEHFDLPLDPAYVLVYEGDNDTAASGKSVPQIMEDFAEVMGRIQATYPTARILIVPTKPSPERFEFWPTVEDLNAAMARYADQHSQVEIVRDLPSALLDASQKNPRPEFYSEDGVHLSEAGYAVWNERIRAHLLP